MFEKLEGSTGNILAVRVTGKLLDADYQKLNDWCEELKKSCNKIRLLCSLEDFEGWGELTAAWDDFQFGLHHRKDVEKFVLVGEKKWHQWAAKFADWFMHGEVKYFEHDKLEQAWDWIKR